ncbi:hypothetical protein NQ317_014249 [Molorchus minor]|uniref:Uncharacterized protein n=1 Tax=Molorchus minor TaxID=1323400 RepID=A0ABQ9J7B6_9CUCU|nr:hypothetical protein NQ317_014249 [Molorchus minor]
MNHRFPLMCLFMNGNFLQFCYNTERVFNAVCIWSACLVDILSRGGLTAPTSIGVVKFMATFIVGTQAPTI